MIPSFSVDPNGRPWASWPDPSDPRQRIASFILAEIYLSRENADEMLRAMADPACRNKGWEWHGNSHSLIVKGNRCVIVDHYPNLGDQPLADLDIGVDQFAEAITAWKEFVEIEALQEEIGAVTTVTLDTPPEKTAFVLKYADSGSRTRSRFILGRPDLPSAWFSLERFPRDP